MFAFHNREIERIAVIGSGQIGPDIALYLSKAFVSYDVPVVVVDVLPEALEHGRRKFERKVDKAVEAGAFSPDLAAAMKAGTTFTGDYNAIHGASLVVEAASEDVGIKSRIFAAVEKLCHGDAVFTSNSSHLEPERIFESIGSRDRTLVTHFFFPAERNPVVEVVPGKDTDPEVANWVMRLLEWTGKVPLRVESRYGYGIDPVFEGLFQAAALCVEERLGDTKEVDAVAREALGLGVGPFTAMNLTGGNPITHQGLAELHERIMPWFQSPRILTHQVESGGPWSVPARDETVSVDDERRRRITEQMRGAYFGLVGEVLDSGIISLADLDLGVEMALDVKAPFRMMNAVGVRESLELVEAYAKDHPGFRVAECLRQQAEYNERWDVPVVLRRDRDDGVAVVTIRRPQVLNAINAEATAQLRATFEKIARDRSVRAVVLTGYGRKAFVSGADIAFLNSLGTADAGEHMSLDFQGAIAAIEDLGKLVVCALNGLALGGGCEIAMGCHARVAPAGLRVLCGQPEVNLGVIPGAGGTQRLPRWVGFEVANEILRTGRPISSERALEIGLVNRLVEGDVVEAAVAFAHEILGGDTEVKPIKKGALRPPAELPPVDLGHLSRKVDEILCRAILEGARMTLPKGLALEAKLFGEVVETKDAHIGLKNFLEKGARSKAAFVHA